MRALLIVLDSVGCGHAPDAAAYGDEGANTLGHILAKHSRLQLPYCFAMGLGQVLGQDSPLPQTARPSASQGRMRERSAGKDTTTGHWEIAGAILEKPFATYERFPEALVQAIEAEGGVQFIGNYPSSGTVILDELGPRHLETGCPILYTSADSVLQIAAHEEILPLEKLYALCEIARRHCDTWQIGRVIARPFLGTPGNFQRTANRHDYSIQPPRTILNALSEAGIKVTGIGKIGDIFAQSGIAESLPTKSNAEGMKRIAEGWARREDGFFFANLVDFDMHFGHRRDVDGYAAALEEFDRWLGEFLPQIGPEDLLIITADHGNDPTWPGTDHTREEVPVLLKYRFPRSLGTRQTFADVAATLARFFSLPPWPCGEPMV
ncbi:MAG: phosphopentomutase [Chthoniobacteraceae bacterium]